MPRLGWHGAVGPQESACITRDWDCSPIFRANGAPPSQPGHRPNMALQGQRPGAIPAWGIAPGNGFQTIFSANGAAHHSGGVDVRTCGMMDRAVGPWWLLRIVSWGDAQAGMAWGRWPARIRPHHARFGLFAHLPRQRRTAIPARGIAPTWLFRGNAPASFQPGHRPAWLLRGKAPASSQPGASPQEMDSKRYSAPTARPIIRAAWYGVDVRTCGMMDRAVGPWWLLRMVSWGDAPGWDGIGPLARKNPPASRAIWIVRPSSAPTAHRHPSPGIAKTLPSIIQNPKFALRAPSSSAPPRLRVSLSASLPFDF